MIAGIISAVVVVIAVVCGIIMLKSLKKDKQNVRKIGEMNAAVLQELQGEQFEASHFCYMTDYSSFGKTENHQKQMLCVDTKGKKLALINYADGSHLIVNFSDLIGYDIYNNGKTDTSGGVVYGLVVAESKEMCQELKLLLRLKSFENPQFEYILISQTLFNSGIDKGTNHYRLIMNDLQQTVAYLELILNENKADNS